MFDFTLQFFLPFWEVDSIHTYQILNSRIRPQTIRLVFITPLEDTNKYLINVTSLRFSSCSFLLLFETGSHLSQVGLKLSQGCKYRYMLLHLVFLLFLDSSIGKGVSFPETKAIMPMMILNMRPLDH